MTKQQLEAYSKQLAERIDNLHTELEALKQPVVSICVDVELALE